MTLLILLLHMPFSFITPLIQTSRHKIEALIVMFPQLRCQFLANGTGNQVKNCFVYFFISIFFSPLLLWIYISIAHAPSFSLMGALTSIIFVATRQLCLLRQNMSFVATGVCLLSQTFGTKTCLLQQQKFATKHVFCRNRSMLVVTKFCHKNMSRQNICHDKYLS